VRVKALREASIEILNEWLGGEVRRLTDAVVFESVVSCLKRRVD